jgi:hypothetical protein
MLPGMTIPASLAGVLAPLRVCFTAPTFATFTALLLGLVGATRRRTVCGMWIAAGLSSLLHHCRAHRFFSHARWCVDQVGLVVARMAVDWFVGADEAVVAAVDDSLFRRYGRGVHAAAWQHDGSAQGPRKIGFGNCWVIVGIVVTLPVLSRPVCLPVLFRLWQPKSGISKVEHAVELARLLTAALPDRSIHVVGDAAYHGPACKTLPQTVSWTCRLQRNAVLYDLAPARTGKRGRPRLKGHRLGTPADLAATATWQTITAHRYGRADTISVAVITCLWYGAFGARPVQVMLVREPDTITGYDLALVSTDLTATPAGLICRYASRWSVEVVNLEAKHVLGVGQARNRLPTAVRRTVPFGLLAMTLVTIWYARLGHHPDDVNQRQTESPWYPTKTEPSFEDMLVKLRRTIIAARFSPVRPAQPTLEETRAVQQAWAAAAA